MSTSGFVTCAFEGWVNACHQAGLTTCSTHFANQWLVPSWAEDLRRALGLAPRDSATLRPGYLMVLRALNAATEERRDAALTIASLSAQPFVSLREHLDPDIRRLEKPR